MSPEQRNGWKDNALVEVLRAIASDQELRSALIFKGARILNRHLNTHRQSLDIDSNLTMEFQQNHPDRKEQAGWFEKRLEPALRHYFESQDPVRYKVESVKVANRPKLRPHEKGWNALDAKFRILDAQFVGVLGLPALDIDIAAPETLGKGAICELEIDGSTIQAYALHRIAGEKLRAFLSTLPAYRKKLDESERSVRAKDLYDLVRVLAAKPLKDSDFWDRTAGEFILACGSRYVDCEGLSSFHEGWDRTAEAYQSDATLKEISWTEAANSLTEIVGFLDQKGIFPLRFPLPGLAE